MFVIVLMFNISCLGGAYQVEMQNKNVLNKYIDFCLPNSIFGADNVNMFCGMLISFTFF